MPVSSFLPVLELTRGDAVESVHSGAIAVVNVYGELIARYGDPGAVTFLRSSAKPFQVLPFLAHGGQEAYGITDREVAIMCASHSGTDEHVAVVRSIQAKTGVSEAELLCGVHEPFHKPTAQAMRERNVQSTSNRHNCSGKHSGMLVFAQMKARLPGAAVGDLPYIDPEHTIQQEILRTFAEMCAVAVEEVLVGVDGCSAPIFAVPLRHAALAYARLCDPVAGGVAPGERVAACRKVCEAMTANPDMVAGPERFDTRLMEVGKGYILAKGGAEGYQGIGLMPGALGPGSPAVGIALKVADGDPRDRARPTVTLETLRQLGALSPGDLDAIADFGPGFPVLNWRKIAIGEAYPTFALERNASAARTPTEAEAVFATDGPD